MRKAGGDEATLESPEKTVNIDFLDMQLEY